MIFVLGAGASHNEGFEENVAEKKRPPLDKEFFSKYEKGTNENANSIAKHLCETYGIDIYNGEYNSLEKIMVLLYTDIFRSPDSLMLFQKLIVLLNKRLAESTNKLNSNPKSSFYKIVKFYCTKVKKPDQITFITFNYDIQIEKLLDEMSIDENYDEDRNLLNFPYCYNLPKIFEPKEINLKTNMEFFDKGSKEERGVNILKLHGSLNWYGYFEKPIKKKATLFNKHRKMNIYLNKTLVPKIKKTSKSQEFRSFPMIVPPVINKSEIFHENIDHIWKQAEEKLKKATEIIIFGYSFPAFDLESVYLFKGALKGRNDINLSIIDPDPSVIQKFINITNMNKINWYKSSSEFLKHIN
ncbi:hypothetical protein METP3_01662 [Methanosarcinales archaeon]|nr:hypothetical protein METP3_01662 [Methanosarcinales archaeon]